MSGYTPSKNFILVNSSTVNNEVNDDEVEVGVLAPQGLTLLRAPSGSSNSTFVNAVKVDAKNGWIYVLFQFTKAAEVHLNGFRYDFTAERSQLVLLRYPHHQTKKSQLKSIKVVDFIYNIQHRIIWTNLSIGSDEVAVVTHVFGGYLHGSDNGSLLEETVKNGFLLFQFDKESCDLKRKTTLTGFINVGVDYSGKDLYLNGTGRGPFVIGSKTISNPVGVNNFLVIRYDSNSNIKWTKLGYTTTPDSFSQINANALIQKTRVTASGDLVLVGCFNRYLTLDKTYNSSDHVQAWWGLLTYKGEWSRSGVMVLDGTTLSDDFINGEDILSTDHGIYLIGTFKGTANGKTTVTPKVFLTKVDSNKCKHMSMEVIDTNISPGYDAISPNPRLIWMNSTPVAYMYFDTYIKTSKNTFVGKGSIDLAVMGVDSLKVMNSVEGYDDVTNSELVAFTDGELLVGGGSSNLTNRFNAFLTVID